MAQPGSGLITNIAQETAPLAEDVIAASPMAMLVVNDRGSISRANAASEVLLNASAQALIGRQLTEVLRLPSAYDPRGEGAFAAYDTLLSTGRGAHFHADLFVTPFSDLPGWKLLSMHSGAAAHRVGHRLEGGSGARAAVRIAASLAHEIKNPLSGIRGAAQLLEPGSDASGAELTRLIRTEVDRIAALIDRMQGFTDPPPPELKPENVHAILDHARAVAKSGFGERMMIRDAFDPSLPPVLVHRDSLVQIMLNLLKNAAETTKTGETRDVLITTAFRHGVAVAGDGERDRRSLPIEVCVIDDGPGAAMDIVDALFEPFVSNKPRGHGLGLALVDKLVRDMGGIIQYAREGTPERTVFRLLLPRGDGDVA
jgi:two-component system, NtrC family, nitrogen regulation sensor histidine kinase GlnL